MWLPITIISMLLCATNEIIGKKTVAANQENNVLKLRISSILTDAIVLVFLWITYYRGTGTNPWTITLENPMIILVASLNALELYFFLRALKYIGLTIQEAYSGASAILLVVGMIFINLLFGKIADVKSLFVPVKMIIVIIMLAASFVLPRLKTSTEETAEISKTNKRNVILGLSFSFIGFGFDAAENLIVAYTFAESDISSIDYVSSSFLVALFWGVIFYAILYFKSRKIFNPLKKTNLYYLFYGVASTVYLMLYLYGVSLAPVQSNIFWVAYPIFPIIGSALFLKERYSVKQYICIAVIATSSMVFGLMN